MNTDNLTAIGNKNQSIINQTNKDNKYNQGGKFNEALFNTDFVQKINEQIKYAEMLEQQKLNEINQYYIYEIKKQNDEKKELTISDFFVIWVDNIRDIIVDILKFNYNLSDFFQIFTKGDRMFYFGITIITVFIVYYFIKSYFFTESETNDGNKLIINNYLNKSEDHENIRNKLQIYDSDEMLKILAKEMAKETAKETAKEMAKEMAKETAKEMAKETAKETAKEIAKEMAKETAKEMAKDITNVTEMSLTNSSGGYIFAEKHI
jgi:hypothetical protein